MVDYRIMFSPNTSALHAKLVVLIHPHTIFVKVVLSVLRMVCPTWVQQRLENVLKISQGIECHCGASRFGQPQVLLSKTRNNVHTQLRLMKEPRLSELRWLWCQERCRTNDLSEQRWEQSSGWSRARDLPNNWTRSPSSDVMFSGWGDPEHQHQHRAVAFKQWY